MQVSQINSRKIKIVLTDTEVICCFGAYEKLLSMNDTAKALIKALLRDIAAEYRLNRLTARIHVKPGMGCIIILRSDESKTKHFYTAEFYTSEALIKTALCLKRLDKGIRKSLLYKTEHGYRLLIESDREQDFFLPLYEFCNKLYYGRLHFEYTKEYGNPLITDNALPKISACFIKGF